MVEGLTCRLSQTVIFVVIHEVFGEGESALRAFDLFVRAPELMRVKILERSLEPAKMTGEVLLFRVRVGKLFLFDFLAALGRRRLDDIYGGPASLLVNFKVHEVDSVLAVAAVLGADDFWLHVQFK